MFFFDLKGCGLSVCIFYDILLEEMLIVERIIVLVWIR